VVAKLVPQSQAPQVITRIEPSQIDQVYLGQEALLRPMTRNQNDLEVQAKITRVAEALKNDPNTGAPYYEVVLEPSLEAFYERGGEAISGTPFEVAIQTQARTPWEYFMEPIKRSFRRSLRE
jgi:HlyD family secretion protein